MLCYSLMSKEKRQKEFTKTKHNIYTPQKGNKVIIQSSNSIPRYMPNRYENTVHTKPCTQMLTAALFAVQKVCAMLNHSTLLQPHGL